MPTSPQMEALDPDDRLVARWCAGETAAFDALVARHGPAIHGFLRTLMLDRAAAEDAWTETWIRVLRARDRYLPEQRFRAWLFTIARRCAKDQKRSARRRLALGLAWQERGPGAGLVTSPELRVVRSRDHEALGESLAELREEHRAILVLTYRHDLSSEEIGRILDLTAQQNGSRLTYARRLLRERLESRGVSDD